MAARDHFILGIDLDGVVADYYGYMRTVAAEWLNIDVSQLTEDVGYGLNEWGIPNQDQYRDLHRFAVTQRKLFGAMPPIPGAPLALRRLSAEGVRNRIITHRLVIKYFHQIAVRQTIEWLDYHDIPYWDLCFMNEKGDVGADLYIEDTPQNILKLRDERKKVIIYSNSTNRLLPDGPDGRANTWEDAERMIRDCYYNWRTQRHLALPPSPGTPPPGEPGAEADKSAELPL
jgi:5'(3')-deoxyribonucleotidase